MHTEPAGQEPRRGIPCPLSLRPGNSRFSREELHQTLMVVYTAPVLSLPINRNLVARGPDPSSKATLFIIRKIPQDPHTPRDEA